MQQHKQERKKPYRARGSRGGRRKKKQNGQYYTNANATTAKNDCVKSNTTNGVYMQMPFYMRNNQYVHRQNRDTNYARQPMTTYVNSQQLYPPEQFNASNSNYFYQQNIHIDYSSFAPPLPLVQTSSSFSSQSTSSSYETASLPLVEAVNSQGKCKKEHFQTPIGRQTNKGTREHLRLDVNATSLSEYWPSLFSISPRSFLMGRKSK